jgi:predicted HicB family RNase H-like nuclease
MKDFIHYKGYYGSVHFEQEDMVFHGKVEFIRALIIYESTNAKGLKKAFEEAVDDYLGMCRQEKIEPEIPFKGSLNIRLGSKLHRSVALEASFQKLSINKYIAKILMETIHQY